MSISSVCLNCQLCTVVACMYSQLPAFLLCSSPQPFLSSGLYHTFQSLFIPKPLINTLPGSLPADLQVFRQRRCEQNLSLAASFLLLSVHCPAICSIQHLPSLIASILCFCVLFMVLLPSVSSHNHWHLLLPPPPLSYKVKFCFIFGIVKT